MTREPGPVPSPPLQAMLFDMDGVVTDTAEAHAAVWKRLFDEYLEARAERSGEPFRPFDADGDYHEHVDGRPRHDGVRCFLASRGIELPEGSEDDDPDRETVCGLGNRKNGYFHAWLAEHEVATFPGTLAFIRQVKEAGLGVGVFSSSRNAEAVLESASALELFDVRVDGNDLARHGLPGKPDPAMLLEAASRLRADPGRAAIFEDALAGVEAGEAGGFALVVGVDREGSGEALASRGADLVVSDLSELAFTPAGGVRVKTLAGLPSALERQDELRERLKDRQLAIFLDYDGTLTPIVEDHARALISEAMREAVERLAREAPVAIVSGRGLSDLKGRVGLESVFYAGSHGFEIDLPGERRQTLERGKEFLSDLDEAEQALRDRLAAIEGHDVERNRFAISVHYRRVAEGEVADVEGIVDAVVSEHPRLRKTHGKKVFQLQPKLDWHKGRAVRWMLERLGLDRENVLPVYLGDDLTDEDAFRALAGRGIGIAVGNEARRTAAEYRLASPDEVRHLLGLLAEASKGG